MDNQEQISPFMIVAGCSTLVLGSTLAFLMFKKGKERASENEMEEEHVIEELDRLVRFVCKQESTCISFMSSYSNNLRYALSTFQKEISWWLSDCVLWFSNRNC
jgi:hypothetical protein